MASLSFKAVTAFFESKNVGFDVARDEQSIRVSYRLENLDGLSVIIFFDEEDPTRISLRAYEYIKYTEAKTNAMYKLCSDKNKAYRYVKFALEEEERYVMLSSDMIVQLDSCGEVVFDQLITMFQIADDAYPDFMREMFSR